MTRRTGLIKITVVVSLLWLLAGWQAARAQVEKNTSWNAATGTDLAVTFGQTGYHARWQYQHCECGDMLVKVEQVAPDGVLKGDLLLVGGQLLLSHGLAKKGTPVAPLIQAPSLMLKLAYSLLDRSQPSGPYAVADKQKWNVNEKKTNFSLKTSLANGIFAAPWKIVGTGWAAGSDHRRFELSFQFANPTPGNHKQTDAITFSGDLDFGNKAFPYQETSAFDGWEMQWLSAVEDESKPVPKGMTLKQMRAQVKQRQDRATTSSPRKRGTHNVPISQRDPG